MTNKSIKRLGIIFILSVFLFGLLSCSSKNNEIFDIKKTDYILPGPYEDDNLIEPEDNNLEGDIISPEN